MKEFDFFFRTEDIKIEKLIIKNNSKKKKLFKVMDDGELIKLLIIEGKQEFETVLENDKSKISVDEVNN